MPERPRPDFEQVREALRDHDERHEDEAPPPPPPPPAEGEERDDDDRHG